MSVFSQRFNDEELSVAVSELLVATADSSDALIDNSVPEVLSLLRQKLGMDAVFVSEFADDHRRFRYFETTSPQVPVKTGDVSPLESSYCQMVVDGRLPESIPNVAALPNADTLPKPPFPLGAHLSTPVVLKDGRVYGTLCCFSHAPKPELQQRDLNQLRACAQLVARKVEHSIQQRPGTLDTDWVLEPMEPVRRR